jgi:hypothetical protein
VSFGEEEVERVTFAQYEIKVFGYVVEGHRGRLTAVDTAEVDGQVPIDENKDIIVSAKPEDFSAPVDELGGGFQSEVIVVCSPFIAETQIVDGEELEIVKHEESLAGRQQLEWQVDADVYTGNISVPLVKILAPRRGWRRWANVDRLVVVAQVVLHDAAISAQTALEVRVTRGEVSNSNIQLRGERDVGTASPPDAILAPLCSCAARGFAETFHPWDDAFFELPVGTVLKSLSASIRAREQDGRNNALAELIVLASLVPVAA